ncbi:hypothetical protein ASD00_27110 [Ensifer sp. Root31]|nr:hypothetical protein ASD00_27110 [Ensifer sp. Root31]
MPKTQVTSIWGNVNIQALAREVEDQSSHLFGAIRPVVQEVIAPTASCELVSALEPVAEEIALEVPSDPTGNSADSTAPISPSLEDVAEPAPTAIELPIENTGKIAKKTPRRRILRAVMPDSKAADEPQKPLASAETTPVTVDQLAALDAENKRLRQLLANQLRAENAELERMLKRF